jgi:hypothetical protein
MRASKDASTVEVELSTTTKRFVSGARVDSDAQTTLI